MSPLDQETIALRHFEGLSNVETAEVLGITDYCRKEPLRACDFPAERYFGRTKLEPVTAGSVTFTLL